MSRAAELAELATRWNELADDVCARRDRGVVYFVGFEDDGPIKVGISTINNLKGRLSNIQTSYHTDLKVWALAFCRSSQAAERIEMAYHLKWEKYRVRGEWFRRTADIESEMSRINAGGYKPKGTRKKLKFRVKPIHHLSEVDRRRAAEWATAIAIGGSNVHFTSIAKDYGVSPDEVKRAVFAHFGPVL